MPVSIKNWNTFQHFKDRSPPWIKLYRYLLDDPDWHALDGESAKALVMLWLIASEDHGRLPDIRKIAFRLRVTEKKASQLLNDLSQWLIQDDIAPISDRCQDDAPETERETYREETEKEAPTALSARDELGKVLDSEHVDAVIEHRKKKGAPLSPRAAKLLAARFASCPNPNAAADEMIVNGWQGFNPAWLANKKNGPDPPLPSKPPSGLRDARSTSEYVAYMREKLNDPKIEVGDHRLSRHQLVPVDWPNVTPLRRVG